MVDDLRARIAELERTEKEAEECLIETRRQLALTTDEKIALEQQFVSFHVYRFDIYVNFNFHSYSFQY